MTLSRSCRSLLACALLLLGIVLVPTGGAIAAAVDPVDDDAARALDSVVETNPMVLFGHRVDAAGRTEWVAFADADTSSVQARRPGEKVVRGKLTYQHYKAAQDRLLAIGDRSTPKVGQATFGAYADQNTGTLVLRIGEGDDAALTSLAKSYPGEITIERVPGSFRRTTRVDDRSPFFGGAGWAFSPYSSSTGNCSTGFRVTANNGAGPRYMVSAAHCSPSLATGGTAYTGPSATLNNAGTVQFITSEFPARDILLIGGASYSNSIYTGTGFTGSNQFFSAGDPGLNFVYCNGGVVTRAACNIRVRNTSFLFCDISGCTPDLVYLSRDDRSNVVCLGDSGGPLYYISGSNALIRGMVVGEAGGSPCAPELYTHKWSTIQQRYTLAAP